MKNLMILFDLDGTLLTSDGIVSSVTANILKHCKFKGYHIGYITARSRSMKNTLLLDGLPYDFIAFYNGAVIYAKNKLIESNVLPYQQTISMLHRLNQDYPDMIIDIHQEPWNFSNAFAEACHMYSKEKKLCSLNSLPKCDIQRIRLKSDHLKFIPLEKYMNNDSIFYHTRFDDAIVVHKNANKAHVAKLASEYFGIPTAQMIAFGDDTNDIDMFNLVGTSVAMGNAVPSLKKIANYITETNDNNGIASWIGQYLIK